MREWRGELGELEVLVRMVRLRAPIAADIRCDGERIEVDVNEAEDDAERLFEGAVEFFQRERCDEGDWAEGPWPLMELAYKLAHINHHNVGPALRVVEWRDEPRYLGMSEFEYVTRVHIHVY